MATTSPPRPAVGRLAVAACVTALACAGCGSESKGHRVSGKVTFKGQPVAVGKIYFTPDASKKNEGMPGYAAVRDGSYDTSAKGSQGVGGGPMIVRIEGYDGEKLIFVYDTTADLPAESSTKDFDVPESAAVTLKDAGPPP